MLRNFQLLSLVTALGVFSSGNAASADSAPQTPITHKKTVQLKDLLTTGKGIITSAGQLTISPGGPGYIHFLKTYFYSDTGCSVVLGAASVIDNGAGFPFYDGQTVSLNSSAAYQLANNLSIPTGGIACLKLYVDGSNATPNAVTCQDFNDETCSGSSCLSSQIKTVNWDSANQASPCAPRHAYVVNNDTVIQNPSVTNCTILSDGTLDACGASGTFVDAMAIAINNSYAYVVSQSDSTVSLCSVDASNGDLSTSCNPTGDSFFSPAGIALNSGHAYITNLVTGTVSLCAIDASTGELSPSPSSCGTAITGLTNPTGIVINNNIAYITGQSNIVYKCPIDPMAGGAFTSCTPMDVGTTQARGITTYNGYAYITDGAAVTIRICTIDTTPSTLGDLINCDSTGSGFFTPVGVSIVNGYAYISNANVSSVFRCNVSPIDGTLDPCVGTGSDFSYPFQMAIY